MEIQRPPAEVLDALRAIPTPAVANAIESFKVRPFTAGYAGPGLRAMAADPPAIIGFAVTARTIAAAFDPGAHRPVPRLDYYKYIEGCGFNPRIAVIQDLTAQPELGGFYGEVNANVHRALGCVGAVTNSGVRDLAEMEGIGFATWAGSVIVGHDIVIMVDCGAPVAVGGLLVHHGDLLLADRHGVIHIPMDLAAQIPDRVREMEKRERTMIDCCQGKDFSAQVFAELLKKK